MHLPVPPEIQPTNEMVRIIGGIDEFKGEWRARVDLGSAQLQLLQRSATIESLGSSARIEGARLGDEEVVALLENPLAMNHRNRDARGVAGGAAVTEAIQSAWRDLPLTEEVVLQLHSDLLRHSVRNERHRGSWKTHPNPLAVLDAAGNETGRVFETASPRATPRLMERLLSWHAREEADPELHPLIRIAVFNALFLSIRPFEDGNGRLARALTDLQLLRAGYDHDIYSSLESVIEHRKEAYHLALRRTRVSFQEDPVNWHPWLLFFLGAMRTQIERLREHLKELPEGRPQPEGLSSLAGELLMLLESQGSLTIRAAADALQANRNTLKVKFAELVRAGFAELRGKGRGAHYRSTRL